jgi:hypothetical protein
MIPEFSSCSSAVHHNIRLPIPYGWIDDIMPRSDDPEWDDKLDERLLWRGSNTGLYHLKNNRWRRSHRISLVEQANQLNGTLRLLAPRSRSWEVVGEPKQVRKSRINPAILDIAFAGQPISCETSVCEVIAKDFSWRQRQGIKEAGNYKYVLDVGREVFHYDIL